MGVDGNLLQAHTATLYEVLRYVIKPASEPKKVSYVEFLGAGPQLPLWCVSHFTGMPFKDLLECLEQHARDRGISEYAPYWIGVFAINHHALPQEAAVDNPYKKALDNATGSVTIIDREALLKRVWCVRPRRTRLFGASRTSGTYTRPWTTSASPPIVSMGRATANARPLASSMAIQWPTCAYLNTTR